MPQPKSSPNKLPKQIGKYHVEGVLGRGGMGIVYKARDPRMDRYVAIKTLTGNLTDENALKRFYREAEKTGRLNHANIITIYDLGEEEGHPYIVMQFVEGRGLDSILREENDLPLPHKLRILEQVCHALGYAHANDVVHRDVKPANVMVCPDGLVKLLDFGIALQERSGDSTLTQTGLVIGTVPYMAPERLQGHPVDGRCDIFATGVLMFQLLTRELPFQGDELALVNKLIHDPHPALSSHSSAFPKALDDILDRALAKSPADRYPLAEEMASDLASAFEVTRQQYIAEIIARAQAHTQAHDPLPARELFLEVLKLDPQQATARRMLAEINQNLSRRQHIEHAELKRRQAGTALLERNYDLAVNLLEEALRLVPDSTDINAQLDSARQKKKINEQILLVLRQAEEAKRSGEISKALAMVQQALKLDTTNARVRIAYNALLKQAEEAEGRAKARELLQSARAKLATDRYEEAYALIREAEHLDPTNLEIQSVAKTAREEVRLAFRRSRLSEIEGLIASARNEDDWRLAAATVEATLGQLPSDPLLLRYKLQIDRQLGELLHSQAIMEHIRHAWKIFDESPSEALAYIERALTDNPSTEQLLTLAGEFRSRIQRQTQDETRRDHLMRARHALDAQDFGGAVAILEQCQKNCFSEDVAELLDFARDSINQQRFRRLVVNAKASAIALLNEGRTLEAIQTLQAVLDQDYDETLANLLAQAQAKARQSEDEKHAILSRIHDFAQQGLHPQVLIAIDALPTNWRSADELSLQRQSEAALTAQRISLQQIGQAYGSLRTQRPMRDWADMKAAGNGKLSSFLCTQIAEERTALADAALRGAILATASSSRAAVAAQIQAAQQFGPYASRSVKHAWTRALWRAVSNAATSRRQALPQKSRGQK